MTPVRTGWSVAADALPAEGDDGAATTTGAGVPRKALLDMDDVV